MLHRFGMMPRIETERLTLRLPEPRDFADWARLRRESRHFLAPWEPRWSRTHLTRRSFRRKCRWARQAAREGVALPLLLVRREDRVLLGAITLDNIRRGPAQSASLGYWVGERFARQGYMREAIEALVHHAFRRLDLSRIEAACLEENVPSRGLLESCGFRFEGRARAYLQIDGRWRDHVLYARLRDDRKDGAPVDREAGG